MYLLIFFKLKNNAVMKCFEMKIKERQRNTVTYLPELWHTFITDINKYYKGNKMGKHF